MKEAIEYLKGLQAELTTANLVGGWTPDEFKAKIEDICAQDDFKMESYESPENQRDQSIKFQWGHDHDFGTFKKQGMMADRHIGCLAQFIGRGWLPKDLSGKTILEVGSWTGGMSMLLAKMGAKRVAVFEEVNKYAACVGFLAKAFDLEIEAHPVSIYVDREKGENAVFVDLVVIAGVLYHVSDPVVALRRCWESLKVGGSIMVETACIDSDKSVCAYMGPRVVTSGSKEQKNRTGWNWFMPSPSALKRMMEDVQFDGVQVEHWGGDRWVATGTKTAERPMCLAGVNL